MGKGPDPAKGALWCSYVKFLQLHEFPLDQMLMTCCHPHFCHSLLESLQCFSPSRHLFLNPLGSLLMVLSDADCVGSTSFHVRSTHPTWAWCISIPNKTCEPRGMSWGKNMARKCFGRYGKMLNLWAEMKRIKHILPGEMMTGRRCECYLGVSESCKYWEGNN